MDRTDGHLLGGRLRYAQPKEGYRTGIEPVLLAASIPARPGDRVLEAGAGAGAALICLAARLPGITGVGVEIDPAMADLARSNLAANGLTGIEIRTGDILDQRLAGFDHALANPPWHGARSTPSPSARRRLAKQAPQGALEAWVAALARALRPGGTLTLILPHAAAPRADTAMHTAGLANIRLLPLLPKPGRTPKLCLIQSYRPLEQRPEFPADSHRTPPTIILHEASGAYTPQIEAVLRHGAALDT